MGSEIELCHNFAVHDITDSDASASFLDCSLFSDNKELVSRCMLSKREGLVSYRRAKLCHSQKVLKETYHTFIFIEERCWCSE